MNQIIGTFHNVETGEIVVRQLTDDEIKEFYPNGLSIETINSDIVDDVSAIYDFDNTDESNLLNSTAEPASEDTEDEPSNP